MPTCKTCRGEYTRGECICPVCSQKLGGRGTELCHKCGAEIRGRRLCPRCRSDVSMWEKESFSLSQFIAKGGFIGLLPVLVAVILWIVMWGQQENSIHHPIGSIVGIILSLLVFSTLFSGRYSLRETAWASEIYHVPGPSPFWIGTGSLLIGIALMVAAVTLYKVWPTPTHFSEKLFFALVYGLAYIGLTTGLTFLPLQRYLARLNERVPQPIFVHTDRLLEIVLRTTANSLKGKRESEGDAENGQADEEESGVFDVIEVSRNPAGGGIHVLARECKFVRRPDTDSTPKIQWVEQAWSIDADKWGRIRSLKPIDSHHNSIGFP